MFDYLYCDYPLPVELPPEPDGQKRSFQTKDTSRNDWLGGCLDDILINEDGKFMRSIWESHEKGKTAWQSENFNGEVYFYDNYLSLPKPAEWNPHDKLHIGWVEFKATFVNGFLTGPIELVQIDKGDSQ